MTDPVSKVIDIIPQAASGANQSVTRTDVGQASVPQLTTEGAEAAKKAQEALQGGTGQIKSGAQGVAGAQENIYGGIDPNAPTYSDVATKGQQLAIKVATEGAKQIQQINLQSMVDMDKLRNTVSELGSYAKISPRDAWNSAMGGDMTKAEEYSMGGYADQIREAKAILMDPEATENDKYAAQQTIDYARRGGADISKNQSNRVIAATVLSGIGVFLGSIGAAYNQGRNVAYENLQKNIDRAIDLQKTTYTQKLAGAIQQFGIAKEQINRAQINALANNLAMANVATLIKSSAEVAAGKMVGAGAKANAQIISGQADNMLGKAEQDFLPIYKGVMSNMNQEQRSALGNLLNDIFGGKNTTFFSPKQELPQQAAPQAKQQQPAQQAAPQQQSQPTQSDKRKLSKEELLKNMGL